MKSKKILWTGFIFCSIFFFAFVSLAITSVKERSITGFLFSALLTAGASLLNYKLWKKIHNGFLVESISGNIFKDNKFIIIMVILSIFGISSGLSNQKANNLSNKETIQKANNLSNKETISENKKDEKPQEKQQENSQDENTKEKKEELPTCDGKKVTSNCKVGDITYSKYIYHPAQKAVTHTEKVQTGTKNEYSNPYTLCADGSRSGATGKGACSKHGGVAEWKHRDLIEVPIYEEKTIIDSPAKNEYYEKVVKDK